MRALLRADEHDLVAERGVGVLAQIEPHVLERGGADDRGAAAADEGGAGMELRRAVGGAQGDDAHAHAGADVERRLVGELPALERPDVDEAARELRKGLALGRPGDVARLAEGAEEHLPGIDGVEARPSRERQIFELATMRTGMEMPRASRARHIVSKRPSCQSR